MKILQVNNLSVKYKYALEKALDHISFEIEEGTITALLGPNGSGKSTILKAILGFIKYEGEILIENKPAFENLGLIGYVPQRFSFDTSFPITVWEFLQISTPKPLSTNENILTALFEVDLLNKKDNLLSALSGGQLQRVLIARAFIKKPKILILDEPEAGIDISISQKFYKTLKDLSQNKKVTILIATHELDIVSSFSDNVICLNKKILCQGKPAEVLSSHVFDALYEGSVKVYPHNH